MIELKIGCDREKGSVKIQYTSQFHFAATTANFTYEQFLPWTITQFYTTKWSLPWDTHHYR